MNNNQHPGEKWVRTCNECRNVQDSPVPPVQESAYLRYAEAKCKKCKSTGLDYGKWVADDATQKVKDQGYRAQAQGVPLSCNPYTTAEGANSANHWNWRAGWLEAHRDSN